MASMAICAMPVIRRRDDDRVDIGTGERLR
jgi:hypothetical protein